MKMVAKNAMVHNFVGVFVLGLADAFGRETRSLPNDCFGETRQGTALRSCVMFFARLSEPNLGFCGGFCAVLFCSSGVLAALDHLVGLVPALGSGVILGLPTGIQSRSATSSFNAHIGAGEVMCGSEHCKDVRTSPLRGPAFGRAMCCVRFSASFESAIAPASHPKCDTFATPLDSDHALCVTGRVTDRGSSRRAQPTSGAGFAPPALPFRPFRPTGARLALTQAPRCACLPRRRSCADAHHS